MYVISGEKVTDEEIKNFEDEISEVIKLQGGEKDFDKKLADNIISDTIILEWIDYCLVLKSVGYSDNEMFNIINAIFDRNYIEKPIEGNFEQSD